MNDRARPAGASGGTVQTPVERGKRGCSPPQSTPQGQKRREMQAVERLERVTLGEAGGRAIALFRDGESHDSTPVTLEGVSGDAVLGGAQAALAAPARKRRSGFRVRDDRRYDLTRPTDEPANLSGS